MALMAEHLEAGLAQHPRPFANRVADPDGIVGAVVLADEGVCVVGILRHVGARVLHAGQPHAQARERKHQRAVQNTLVIKRELARASWLQYSKTLADGPRGVWRMVQYSRRGDQIEGVVLERERLRVAFTDGCR